MVSVSSLEILFLIISTAGGSSVWTTTNQRVYQAEPVFERAR